jgi:hypothetical protein
MRGCRVTEEDLQALGLTAEGGEVVPLPDSPDGSWGLDRLRAYAVGQLEQSKGCERQAVALSKKSAVHLYRAGHAFALIRQRLKGEKAWMDWLRGNRLAYATVTQAIQVYERAASEEAVAHLSITDAKEQFGIIKPKPRTGPRTGSNPTPPAASGPGNDEPGDDTPSGDDQENGAGEPEDNHTGPAPRPPEGRPRRRQSYTLAPGARARLTKSGDEIRLTVEGFHETGDPAKALLTHSFHSVSVDFLKGVYRECERVLDPETQWT